MRKLLSFHVTSLDGYYEGPSQAFDWPVVLGDGKSLFRTAPERVSLNLLQARPFRSGNVLLRYQPAAR